MRCKMCNTPLSSREIKYYPDKHTHEDLCNKCISIVWKDMFETFCEQDKPEEIEKYFRKQKDESLR